MNNTIPGIENIVTKLWDENSVKEYRPIPFWSWNDKLQPEELKRQIKWMADEGFGGYFMHAFACSAMAANASLSETASSASILRLSSIPAFLRPCIRVE